MTGQPTHEEGQGEEEEEVDLEEDVDKEDEDQIYPMRFEQHWLTNREFKITGGKHFSTTIQPTICTMQVLLGTHSLHSMFETMYCIFIGVQRIGGGERQWPEEQDQL